MVWPFPVLSDWTGEQYSILWKEYSFHRITLCSKVRPNSQVWVDWRTRDLQACFLQSPIAFYYVHLELIFRIQGRYFITWKIHLLSGLVYDFELFGGQNLLCCFISIHYWITWHHRVHQSVITLKLRPKPKSFTIQYNNTDTTRQQ